MIFVMNEDNKIKDFIDILVKETIIKGKSMGMINELCYQNTIKKPYTEKYIKENFIQPVVEKYLRETDMGYGDSDENGEEIEECTDSAGVGDFAYDAPAFTDKETANHKNLIKRSIPKGTLGEEVQRTFINKVLEGVFHDILNEAPETALTRAYKWLDFNDPETVENFINAFEGAKSGGGNNDAYLIRNIQNKIIKSGQDNPELLQNPNYKQVMMIIDPNHKATFYQNKSKNSFGQMMEDLINDPQKWNDRVTNQALKEKYKATQVGGVLGAAWNLLFKSLNLIPPLTNKNARNATVLDQVFGQELPRNITNADVLPFVTQVQNVKTAKEKQIKAKETVTGVTKNNEQLIGKIMKRLYTYLTKYYKDNFDLDFNKRYQVGPRTDDNISLKYKFDFLTDEMLDDTETMDAIMAYNEILNQPEDRTFLDALNKRLGKLADLSDEGLRREGEELKYKIDKYNGKAGNDHVYGGFSTSGIGGGARRGDY